MNDETPQFTFGDVENYSSDKNELNFRIITLQQLKKISLNANVEFRGGYWNEKVIPMQGGQDKITKEYVPDTREVYSNSIEYLYDLTEPHFDDTMKEEGLAYEKEMDLLEKKFGEFDNEIEKIKFREKRLKICRKLFRTISRFLERKHYFGERSN